MGLVADFYAILAGGLYLLGKGTKEMFDGIDAEQRAALRKQYADQLVDEDLELFFRNELEKPESHEAIWEALERFKRDNPFWCKEHEDPRSPYGPYYDELFGWQCIGKMRLPLVWNGDVYGVAQKKCQDDKRYRDLLAHPIQTVRGNRNAVLNLMLDTQGKKTPSMARWAAEREYPYRTK